MASPQKKLSRIQKLVMLILKEVTIAEKTSFINLHVPSDW